MFKVNKLELIKHDFFQPQTFQLSNQDSISDFYITLAIGSNGTGKSQLLSIIIKIFNMTASAKIKGVKTCKFDCDFLLEYEINGNLIKIENRGRKTTFLMNNNLVELSEILLPNKILAASINLNDRYPFPTKRNKPEQYEYLGIRTASNNAFVNNNLLIDRITQSIASDASLARYRKIFELLGLEENISIRYKKGRNMPRDIAELQKYLVDADSLFEYLSEKIEHLGDKFSIRKSKILRTINNKESLHSIVIFLKNCFNNMSGKRYSTIYEHKFSLSSTAEKESSTAFHTLRLIRDLELLSIDKLILHKNGGKYTLDQASSGEYHMLSSLIGMVATIENDSIVFIDEPEISLHPNWQIRYIELIKSIFKDLDGCHFIISTHSHFLATDLPPNKSSIICLKHNENGFVYNDTIQFNPYGWGAEQILYKVFGVATTHNFHLEMDLRKLLHSISNNLNNYSEIRAITESLQSFRLTKDDPLLKIINAATEYLKKHDN
ncbi:AAA family ATPase [Aeromonas veronii]